MNTGHKLRIAIDCRIENSQQGVGTAVLALAKALSESKIISQEYTFILREEMQDWLAPYIYGPCKLVGIPASAYSKARALFGWIRPLQFIWHKLRDGLAHLPASDGYIESQHFDVVHFPTQDAYLTEVPSIYQPWDLQHLHYPQFFTKPEVTLRERRYRKFCEQAAFVCVQAQWTKQDLIKSYGIAEEKVVVIPWGSVFQAYNPPPADLVRATLERLGSPENFFFYPAATWPHKNHEAILHALHLLKSADGSMPHVYFTGMSTEYRPTLDKLAQQLGVFEQVHFLGFLSPEELQVVFGAASAMIFASKFEGFGLPILEAFQARLPVISSNATTLPEVAQDAALYFDPDLPAQLAARMRMIMDVPGVREDLIEKGTRVLLQHSMSDTVASFQKLYEKTFELSSQTGRLSSGLATT